MAAIDKARELVKLVLGDTAEKMVGAMTENMENSGMVPEGFIEEYVRIAKGRVIEIAAASYATLMSEEEMQQAIDFYGTKCGRALLGVSEWMSEHPDATIGVVMDALLEAADTVDFDDKDEFKEHIEMMRSQLVRA